MRPETALLTIRVLCWAGSLVAGAITVRADFLEDANKVLSYNDSTGTLRLRLSGLVDLEGYYFSQPAPGLIEAEGHYLLNPRLTTFIDAQWTNHLYFFGQVRFDRGFDPSDKGAQIRFDEYFLRYLPGDTDALTFQLGKFATVVGNWVQRHYSWENPFINAPLPYENLSGIWDVAAPPNVDVLLSWAHVAYYRASTDSDKYLRLPMIWGPSYATGAAVNGFIGKIDFAAEVKNAALASRPESWDLTKTNFDHPTFSGRPCASHTSRRPEQ